MDAPIPPPLARNPSGIRDHPELILNADFRPLSYFPLSLWPWREAVKALFLDRVSIIASYDAVAHSPSVAMRLPLVVSLREYVKPARYPAFTRFNLFLRDEFNCRYCGVDGEMTFDHVHPRCKGERTAWVNVVAACPRCNLRKGSLTVGAARMHLRRASRQPTTIKLQSIGRRFPPSFLHESWMDFLYWDAVLEP